MDTNGKWFKIHNTQIAKDIVLRELLKNVLGDGENSSVKSQSISRDNPEPSS